MYLIAFVFFILSLLGLYAQIYGLQAARMLAEQTPVAEQMFIWHENAHRFVASTAILNADLNRAAGCWLTMTGAGVGGVAAPAGNQRCRSDAAPPVDLDLTQPPGYAAAEWSFNTIAYRPNGLTEVYLVTWIPNPGAGALITRPNVGYTMSDVVNQMRRESRRRGLSALGADAYFGYVQPPALNPPAFNNPNFVESRIITAVGPAPLPVPTGGGATDVIPAAGDFALVSVVR